MADALVEYLYELKDCKDIGITFIYGENDERFLSYSDLYKKSRKVEKYLRNITYDAIITQIESIEEFLCTIWGCLFANKIIIPLKYSESKEDFNRVKNIMNISDTIGMVSDLKGDSKKYFSEYGERIIDVKDLMTYDAVVDYDVYEKSKSEDTIMIQFSSGSTGTPKGIITKNKNLISNVEAMIKKFNMSERDEGNARRILDWIPLTHNLGLIVGHFLTLMRGIDEYIIPTKVFIKNPTLFLEKLDEHKITTTHCPNFALDLLAKYADNYNKKDLDLHLLSVISVGSQHVSAKSCDTFIKSMSKFNMPATAVQPGYGLTEATVVVSNAIDRMFKARYLNRNKLSVGDKIEEIAPDDVNAVSLVEVGTIIDSCRIKIVDKDRHTLGDGYVGEIYLKGDSIVDGYYLGKDKIKPLELDEDGWFNTGDLGFLCEGYLTIVGRSKEVFIINGKNFYPSDLEDVLVNEFPKLKRKITIVGKENLRSEKNEVYVFVLIDKINSEVNDLFDKMKSKINENFQIKIDKVIPVDKFPVTGSGKIQRFKLLELLQKGEYDENLKELEEINKTNEDISTVENKEDEEYICEKLLNIVTDIMGKNTIRDLDNLFDVGFNSVLLIQFMDRINKEFSLEMKVQELINCKTIKDISKEIIRRKNKVNIKTIRKDNTHYDNSKVDDDIAVIGIDLVTADAKDADEFWNNIALGKASVNALSEERLKDSIEALRKIGMKVSEKDFSKGAFLEEVDKFDCDFFKTVPLVASVIHPQQRLALQTAWRAFEDSGYTMDKLKGSKTGVFYGHSALPFVNTFYDYSRFIMEADSDLGAMAAPGNLNSMIVRRISQYFDLNGPCMLVDTACSSSLVAIHTACNSLRNKECDMALVGSVKVDLFPLKKNKIGIESEDGYTRTFDNKASGTGKGEGSAAIVLKPYKKAVEDKDNIYAVIKGSAIDNDGNSIGLTVPNMEAQANVLDAAWKNAKINPMDLKFIEAHGTATKIGDPIEIEGISKAFGMYTNKKKLCAISSVKSNIGHLDHAAGIFGFIKSVLEMYHGKIAPSANYSVPNENIKFDETPVYVNTKLINLDGQEKLYCGVSAFGFAGTNCHIVLQNYKRDNVKSKNKETIFKISANSISSLKNMLLKQIEYIESTEDNLMDICYTADVCKNNFKYRYAVIVSSKSNLVEKLKYIEKNISESESLNIEETYKEDNELNKLCKKYVSGENVKWDSIFENIDVHKVHMPLYIFDKKRCWIEF